MEYYIRLMVPRMCRVMNKRQYKKTRCVVRHCNVTLKMKKYIPPHSRKSIRTWLKGCCEKIAAKRVECWKVTRDMMIFGTGCYDTGTGKHIPTEDYIDCGIDDGVGKIYYSQPDAFGESPAMRIDWAKGESYSVKAYWENGKFIRSERV